MIFFPSNGFYCFCCSSSTHQSLTLSLSLPFCIYLHFSLCFSLSVCADRSVVVGFADSISTQTARFIYLLFCPWSISTVTHGPARPNHRHLRARGEKQEAALGHVTFCCHSPRLIIARVISCWRVGVWRETEWKHYFMMSDVALIDAIQIS